MPFGIAFLIFVSRNPEISQKLGLISAKADLLAYAATDWAAYLVFFDLFIAAAGLFLFTLVTSWVFGREFTDGTLKDILAVPVQRSSIILAKFIVTAAWSVLLTLVICMAGLVMGALIQLPGGSPRVIFQGSLDLLITAGLTIAVVTPFAFLASAGRGYLLPLGGAVLAIMAANLLALAGWGDYFPWSIAGLYAQGKSSLPPVSFWIVFFTALAGMFGTYLWWNFADQNR